MKGKLAGKVPKRYMNKFSISTKTISIHTYAWLILNFSLETCSVFVKSSKRPRSSAVRTNSRFFDLKRYWQQRLTSST